MSIKRELPEVNAGSMADIAFLLLIFFLVTTTIETDKGLNRKLPDMTNDSRIRERNLFMVNLNGTNELLVEGELNTKVTPGQLSLENFDSINKKNHVVKNDNYHLTSKY